MESKVMLFFETRMLRKKFKMQKIAQFSQNVWHRDRYHMPELLYYLDKTFYWSRYMQMKGKIIVYEGTGQSTQ